MGKKRMLKQVSSSFRGYRYHIFKKIPHVADPIGSIV